MNYEERYKQAIEAAKRELHCCGSLDCDAARQVFRLFPELCESEDERIRKEIIERLKWELQGAEDQDAAGCSRQKDIAMFKRGIAWLEKQGEKKQEWSKEDEKILKRINNLLYSLCQIHGSEYEKLHNWLKSLKPQNRWKPSEEQMQALFEAKLASTKNREYFLGLLYENLKKL